MHCYSIITGNEVIVEVFIIVFTQLGTDTKQIYLYFCWITHCLSVRRKIKKKKKHFYRKNEMKLGQSVYISKCK